MTLARAMADMARGAEAVRVTVRRDGKVQSADFEVSGPDRLWVSLLVQAVRVDAEGDRVGAVLTFPSGERVTIGEPAPAASAWEERALAAERRAAAAERQVRDLGAEVERLLAAAGSNEIRALDALRARARSADAPPAARWWQTVGAWGSRFGGGPVVTPYRVEQVEGEHGAWIRSMAGELVLASAERLDGMTPIQAPPGCVGAEERAALVAERDAALDAAKDAEQERIKSLFEIREAIGARDGEYTLDAVRAVVRDRDAARRERDHYYGLLEASTRTATEIHAHVGRLRGVLRDVQEETARHAGSASVLRAANVAVQAERDSLRDALALLESTFRHWAESERNGAREAFMDGAHGKEERLRAGSDAWTNAAEEVARARKAAP